MPIEGISSNSGIGTGEAQVFQPFDSTPYFEAFQKKKEANQQKNNSQEQKIYGQLSPLDKIDIFARDQPIFSKKIGDLRNFTKQNIDKLRSGDADITMQFQNQLSDIYNEANLSKNAREQFEKIGNIVAQNPDKYDPDTENYLAEFSDKSNAGNYNFDPTKVVQYVDIGKDIKSNVQINPTSTGYEFVDEQGNKIKGSSKVVTQQDADKVLESRFFNNPVIHQSAVKQYERAKANGQTNAPDAITWYKQIGRPYLVQKDIDYSKLPTSEGKKGYSFGNGQASNDKYNFVYSEGKDGSKNTINIASLDFPENKPLEMPDPTDPKKLISFVPNQLEKGYSDKKGAWYLTGTDKDGNKISYDLNDVKGKFESNYFINPYDLINKIGAGGTVKTNPNTTTKQPETTNSGLPKKGDTKTLKSGKIAVFDGTKWVLK